MHMQVSKQSIRDLEFNTILEEIGSFVFSQTAYNKVVEISPSGNKQEILLQLQSTNEYLSSLESKNTIPFSEYYEYEEALRHVEIENYHLEEEVFLAIKSNCIQIKQISTHFDNFQTYFGGEIHV